MRSAPPSDHTQVYDSDDGPEIPINIGSSQTEDDIMALRHNKKGTTAATVRPMDNEAHDSQYVPDCNENQSDDDKDFEYMEERLDSDEMLEIVPTKPTKRHLTIVDSSEFAVLLQTPPRESQGEWSPPSLYSGSDGLSFPPSLFAKGPKIVPVDSALSVIKPSVVRPASIPSPSPNPASSFPDGASGDEYETGFKPSPANHHSNGARHAHHGSSKKPQSPQRHHHMQNLPQSNRGRKLSFFPEPCRSEMAEEEEERDNDDDDDRALISRARALPGGLQSEVRAGGGEQYCGEEEGAGYAGGYEENGGKNGRELG
ncbi:hypothetical protein MKZ38_010704 [Zalerion maritima]|uniref:Uncharacterized protein n=1 Tax=Zalerion maritima TaxID=339359 RepID=A0AAD5RS33_9PEZI|nr:hypothetical protein MKZ38_010704 [Zalerion maritima]